MNIYCFPQPTPVGSVHIDSGASAVTRESHPHRDRPSQNPPIRNQVWQVLFLKLCFSFITFVSENSSDPQSAVRQGLWTI